jgi:hypothetical protein
MNNPTSTLDKIMTTLFGSGTYSTATNQWTQDEPNIIQRAMKKIESKFNFGRNTPDPTPTEQYSQKATPAPTPAVQYVEPPKPEVNTQRGARNPNVSKFNIAEGVKDAIEAAANLYNIPASLLYDIALQESSFIPDNSAARNGFPESTARGLFMFNDPTWNTILNSYNNKPGMTLSLPNTERNDPKTAALATAYLIKNGQLGRWNESQGVWGPYYTQEELSPYYSQTVESEIPTINWKE